MDVSGVQKLYFCTPPENFRSAEHDKAELHSKGNVSWKPLLADYDTK